jgi:hypothetical protein
VWLSTYLAGGVTALEALPDYIGSYCFVVEVRDGNLPAVTNWVATHVPTKDVQLQTTERFAVEVDETVVATLREVNRWWARVSFTPPGRFRTAEEYRGYIFCLLDQETLNRRIPR